MSEHKIVVEVGGYNGTTYRMVCSDPDNCEAVFQETSWPDESTCRCTDAECLCREGDHYACADFGRYIQGLGPECQQVPVDGCGLVVWLDELGEESLDVWKNVTIEVPVKAYWESEDGPVFQVYTGEPE
jgi:hypothetical protein